MSNKKEKSHDLKQIPENKRILFLSPHPDDETFAAGAFLKKLSTKNNDVTSLFFTSSPNGVKNDLPVEKKIAIRKKEAEKACGVIGAEPVFLNFSKTEMKECIPDCEKLKQVFGKINPGIVFLPYAKEAHPTHGLVSDVGKSTIKKLENDLSIEEIWQYEVWSPIKKPNFIYFFSDDEMKMKVKAFEKYRSQIERSDFLDAMVGLNLYRGLMGKELIFGFGSKALDRKKYGEAFLRTVL